MIAVASSLQSSFDLGLCKNHRRTNNLQQLDALSFRFLDSANRQSYSLPSRHNTFVCQSSIIPLRASETLILKTVATALSRSYNAFHGNPFVLQLVPGLVIIVFAVWGIAPLVHNGRNLFLKQSDNSWRRSGAHYVTISYLRPLLLWTGATLICRAFDPMVLSSEASQCVKKRLLVFVRSMSTVLTFAYCLSSLIQQAQQILLDINDSSDTRNVSFQFAGKALYSAVWVAAVSLFMELLGFSTQKMLTAGGLGTLLLTLAGREIFTNFLSSLMIHATRPFILNEWIQTKIEGYEVSGTVEHVGWWSPTIIRGDDREAVHIPNHKFTVNVVRNLSQKTHWRIKTYFFISHLDVNKIHHIVADMRKVLAKNPQVEQQRLHRRVFLERIDPEDQALVVLVSCFVKTSHFEEYLCVKEAILLDLLRVISHHRARLATPIRTVQKMQSEEDMENIPFSDTVFTRARAATNRPFLLIEPPYKINGDEKTKAQTRLAHGDEEQANNITSSLSDDSTIAMPPDLKADTQIEEKVFGSEADREISTMSQSEFADTMVATTSQPDSKVESTSPTTSLDMDQRLSEPMLDKKVATTALDPDKLYNKAVATSSDSCVDREVTETSLDQGHVNKCSLSSPDVWQNNRVDNVPVAKASSGPSSKLPLEDLDPTGLNSRDTSILGTALNKSQDSGEAQDDHVATSKVKHETEKLPIPPTPKTKSTLEDNIVLEVAIEGSKRTLLIDEGVPSAPPAEMKKLAACGNGSGSSSAAEDTKSGDQER